MASMKRGLLLLFMATGSAFAQTEENWSSIEDATANFEQLDQLNMLPLRFHCRLDKSQIPKGRIVPQVRLETVPNEESVTWIWGYGDQLPYYRAIAKREGFTEVHRSRYGEHPNAVCVLWHLRAMG